MTKVTNIIVSILLLCSCTLSAQQLPTSIKQALLSKQYQLAVQQLQPLVKKNNIDAMYQLAQLQIAGLGVNKSYKKAVQLLSKACQLQHAKSCYLAASTVLNNHLPAYSTTQVETWLTKATSLGYLKAKPLLAKVKKLNKNNQNSTDANKLKLWIKQQKNDQIKAYLLLNSSSSTALKPLVWSILFQNRSLAKWLIKQIKLKKLPLAWLKQQDTQMNNVLQLAIKARQFNLVPDLIRYKFLLNHQNQQRQTPLILAVLQGQQASAQLIINAGANEKLTDKTGHNAKYYASKNNLNIAFKQQSVKTQITNAEQKQLNLLQQQQQDKNSPFYQWPLLHIAIAQQNNSIINSLVSNTTLLKTTPQHENAVQIAIRTHQTKLVMSLLHRLHNSDLTNQQKITFYRYAIQYKEHSILDALLNSYTLKGDINCDTSPLYFAIHSKDVVIVGKILSKLLPSAHEISQAVLLASQINQPKLVQLLLSRHQQIEINLADKLGRNALWYAIEFDQLELVNLLIQHKAAVNLTIKQVSPLMHAISLHHNAIAKALVQHGARVNDMVNQNNALLLAAKENAEMVRFLISNKADIKVRDHNAFTPLMIAVENQCIDCVKALLKAGANPRRKNARGLDSFDLARQNQALLTLLNQD